MVAYSFKRRFVEPILAGTKAQTIRAQRRGRSRHARPSEPVQLYVGMRTRACRKLAEPRCLSIEGIRIELPRAHRAPEIIVCGNLPGLISHVTFRDVVLDAFAISDGFRDFDDMVAFWRAEHPGQDTFDGVLIRWQPLEPARAA